MYTFFINIFQHIELTVTSVLLSTDYDQLNIYDSDKSDNDRNMKLYIGRYTDYTCIAAPVYDVYQVSFRVTIL